MLEEGHRWYPLFLSSLYYETRVSPSGKITGSSFPFFTSGRFLGLHLEGASGGHVLKTPHPLCAKTSWLTASGSCGSQHHIVADGPALGSPAVVYPFLR